MGWESRNGGRYYYCKRRVGNQVVSEYVGSGPLAELTAVTDALTAQRVVEKRRRWAEVINQHKTLDRRLGDYDLAVKRLVQIALEAAGYHTHKRQWRLRRMQLDGEPTKKDNAPTKANLLATLTAANPTPAQLTELRQTVKDHPELLDVLCNMPKLLQRRIVEQMSQQAAIREVTELQAERLRNSLGYEDSSMLERTLIDHVVTTWLLVHRFEFCYHEFWEKGGTLQQGEYWDRRLGAAHRRFQRAVDSLARVRALLHRVGVQVNIGHNQVIGSNIRSGPTQGK